MDSIQKLKEQRKQQLTNKKSQINYGIILTILLAILYIFFIKGQKYAPFAVFGVVFGFIVTRSRFCFAAAFRDPILTGKTSILRATILGMMIATPAFALKQWQVLKNGMVNVDLIPGQIQAVGWHTIVGGILFGAGMIIAGGCVTGTFMRIGEGFGLQWIVLIGMIMGSVGTAAFFNLIPEKNIFGPKIYLGEFIPLPYLVVLQMLLLAFIYHVLKRYEYKKTGKKYRWTI